MHSEQEEKCDYFEPEGFSEEVASELGTEGLKFSGNTLEKAETQASCLGTHGLSDLQKRTVRPEAVPLTGNHCASTVEHSFQSSSHAALSSPHNLPL